MELVFGTDGEAVCWPDGEPMLMSDLVQIGVAREDHEGFSIKRYVLEEGKVKTIDFGADLDRF